MNKGKRELKSSIVANKNKKAIGGDNNLKNDNSLIMKKKKKRIASQQRRKVNFKDKVTPKHTEDQQTSKNVDVSSERNKDVYECQLERINLILKESSHCPTLTQEELRILFMKYKLDGHFEANKNLPSFPALLDNEQNTINDGHQFHNEARYTPTVGTQYLNYRHNKDTFNNLHHNNVNENQQNFRYNTYKCQENTNKISNMEVNNFPSCSADVENIFPAPHGTFSCENNNIPYNSQYEHFENINETTQQYNKLHAMQYFDRPWNSNVYNNFRGEAWNSNMPLTNRNENYQLWRSENSECIPESINSEWQYGVKNYSEQHVWNMHTPNTNLYPLMNNENSCQATTTTTTANYNNHMQPDTDINTSASSVALNNFLPDSTSFLSSFTNINNHYI